MITQLDIINALPYVTRLENKAWCDGWVYRETYKDGGFIGKSAPCLNYAFYQFKKANSKGKGRHKSGRYCSNCLMKATRSSIYERARFYRAMKKAGIASDGL